MSPTSPIRCIAARAIIAALFSIVAPFILTGARAWAVDASIWDELAKVDELKAAFTQVQHRAVLKQPLRSEGDVAFTRPDALSWTVTAPSRHVFALRGGVARMEYPDLGMVETIDLAQIPDAGRIASSMLVWMKADAGAVARDFDVTYGPATATLRPRDPRLQGLLSEIRLAFAPAPWRVRAVTLLEPDGDRVEIAFHRVVADGVAVPDAE